MHKLSQNAWDWVAGIAWGLIAAAGLVAIGLLMAPPAQAQAPAGELSFTLTQQTSGNQVIPSLIWTTNPRASRCVAAGGWTGSRPVHSDMPLTLAAVTPPKTYTLTCYWDDPDARLRWQPPTENVDGSPLTDLKGYRIYYGNTPATMTTVLAINNATERERVVSPLAAGVWYFAITALNSSGRESARSNTVSALLGAAAVVKTVTATAAVSQPPILSVE